MSTTAPSTRRRTAAAWPSRRLRERLRLVPRAGRTLASAIGSVATVIGIVFVLWPSLKPDPPPVDRGAALSHAQVEPGLSFGGYLDRIEQSRRPYGPAELRRRGAYVEFDFSVRGYKDRRLPLRWQLVDARSGVQLGHSRALRVKPLATKDAGSWNVWIPTPRRPRRMYVQIQLYNEAGTVPIGRVRTHDFTGAGV